MAGKNQHFIPQFLQKGFAITTEVSGGFGKSSKKRKRKKEVSVWVFDSEQRSYCTSTRNKGSERFFYGLENSAVDAVITESETKYAKLVNQLRRHTSSTPIKTEKEDIAELVSHLFVRTKHVRDSGKEAFGILLEMLEALFGDALGFKTFLRNAMQKNKASIQERFDQKVREATPQQQKIVEEQIKRNPNLIFEEFKKMIEYGDLFNPFTPEFFQRLREETTSTVKDAHISTLEKAIAPQSRTAQLKELHWFIHFENEANLILGDEILFCQTTDGLYRSYMNASNEIDYVFIPISSKHLLIGSRVDMSPTVDIDILNKQNAAISREFFIAKKNTQKEKAYASLIGTNSSITSDGELSEIKKNLEKEWFS